MAWPIGGSFRDIPLKESAPKNEREAVFRRYPNGVFRSVQPVQRQTAGRNEVMHPKDSRVSPGFVPLPSESLREGVQAKDPPAKTFPV